MPYKKIEDRRLAWRRWYKKHKEKHLARKKIVSIAKSANPTREVCSIKGCNKLGERHHPNYDKPREIVWLCKHHHELLHSTNGCKVEGCKNKHIARGWCWTHYNQWRRKNGKY